MLSYPATDKKHSSSAQSTAWSDFRSRRTGELLLPWSHASLERLTRTLILVGWSGLAILRQARLALIPHSPCLAAQRNSSASTPTR